MQTRSRTRAQARDRIDGCRRRKHSSVKKCRIASLTIAGRHVNVLVQTAMMAMLLSATLPSGEVYGHVSDCWIHLLVHKKAQEKRSNLRTFGVYERVPKHQAVEKRVRVQWLDDFKRNVDGSIFVRSRIVAVQKMWEPRTDCFPGTPALFCVRLVLTFAATLCRGRRSRLCSLHEVSVAFILQRIVGRLRCCSKSM